MLSAIERAGDRLVGSEGRVNPRSALNFFFSKSNWKIRYITCC